MKKRKTRKKRMVTNTCRCYKVTMFQEVNFHLFLGKKWIIREKQLLKEHFFHSSELLRISLSSATTKIEIYSNLKGLSDTDKYKKHDLMKKEEVKQPMLQVLTPYEIETLEMYTVQTFRLTAQSVEKKSIDWWMERGCGQVSFPVTIIVHK